MGSEIVGVHVKDTTPSPRQSDKRRQTANLPPAYFDVHDGVRRLDHRPHRHLLVGPVARQELVGGDERVGAVDLGDDDGVDLSTGGLMEGSRWF